MRTRTFLTTALTFFLLVACNQRVAVDGKWGNAEGYNGGDAAELKLKAARAKFVERLSDVSKNLLPERLCRFSQCSSSSSPWCRVLTDLTPEQESSCREFLVHALPIIVSRNQQAPIVPVELVAGSLSVTESGASRDVDAETELSEAGKILVSAESVKRLSSEEIEALLFHEFGHKTPWEGRFIGDEGAVGGFSSGRALLDTAAAAFLAYSQSTAVQGFFFVGTQGYYGNTIAHYCQLNNWSDWVRAGGPSAELAPSYSMIPSSMISDGVCVVP